jgi:hypothetical protein
MQKIHCMRLHTLWLATANYNTKVQQSKMQKDTLHKTPHVMASHHYQGSYRSVEESSGTIKYLI